MAAIAWHRIVNVGSDGPIILSDIDLQYFFHGPDDPATQATSQQPSGNAVSSEFRLYCSDATPQVGERGPPRC
jgi:hypothetical protein